MRKNDVATEIKRHKISTSTPLNYRYQQFPRFSDTFQTVHFVAGCSMAFRIKQHDGQVLKN